MTWQRYDDSGQRWTWTGDEARHLLVLAGDEGSELREYHEVPGGAPTVHVYLVHPEADAPRAPSPLESAQHVATYTVASSFAPWVRALDDFELFEWLEAASYVTATGDAT